MSFSQDRRILISICTSGSLLCTENTVTTLHVADAGRDNIHYGSCVLETPLMLSHHEGPRSELGIIVCLSSRVYSGAFIFVELGIGTPCAHWINLDFAWLDKREHKPSPGEVHTQIHMSSGL